MRLKRNVFSSDLKVFNDLQVLMSSGTIRTIVERIWIMGLEFDFLGMEVEEFVYVRKNKTPAQPDVIQRKREGNMRWEFGAKYLSIIYFFIPTPQSKRYFYSNFSVQDLLIVLTEHCFFFCSVGYDKTAWHWSSLPTPSNGDIFGSLAPRTPSSAVHQTSPLCGARAHHHISIAR